MNKLTSFLNGTAIGCSLGRHTWTAWRFMPAGELRSATKIVLTNAYDLMVRDCKRCSLMEAKEPAHDRAE